MGTGLPGRRPNRSPAGAPHLNSPPGDARRGLKNILSSFLADPIENLQRKAEQLVMIDVPCQVLEGESEAWIREHAWGGVILFAKNVRSREQVSHLCADLQKASTTPMLLAVDQEGGLVNRLAFEDSATGCGNMALAATGSEELTYEVCKASAHELRAAGFNVDFAPCVDINSNPRNPIIGVRSFGQSPELVARFGAAAVRGYQDGGISACAKHFPGHGDTFLDSHESLPTVTRPLAQLEKEELLPFQRCIEAGVDSVMTAHIIYPSLDPQPATLSKAILTDLLRQRMGFQGVIYTDSLLMKAIADNYGMGEAAVMSLAAGADMVLGLGPREVQEDIVAHICLAIEEGRLSQDRVDDALRRLNALKRRRQAGQPHTGAASSDADQAVVRQAAEASITVLRQASARLPVAADQRLVVFTPSHLPQSPLGDLQSFPHLRDAFHRHRPHTEMVEYHGGDEPQHFDQLVARAQKADVVLLGLYARSTLLPTHLELARRLGTLDVPLAIALLASPYVAHQLPERATLITGYNCTRPSVDALAQVVVGRLPARGHCPVRLSGICEEGGGVTW